MEGERIRVPSRKFASFAFSNSSNSARARSRAEHGAARAHPRASAFQLLPRPQPRVDSGCANDGSVRPTARATRMSCQDFTERRGAAFTGTAVPCNAHPCPSVVIRLFFPVNAVGERRGSEVRTKRKEQIPAFGENDYGGDAFGENDGAAFHNLTASRISLVTQYNARRPLVF